MGPIKVGVYKMIQWFPGHMAKAKQGIIDKLSLVDIVFELIDARVPLSSRNPMIDEIIKNKPRLILMTKSEMSDPSLNKSFINYFEGQGSHILSIDAFKNFNKNRIYNKTREVLQEKILKDQARGLKTRPIRAMIIGIPNVGKSTLINRLVDKKVANVGDRPGVTKSEQWIRINPLFELLDTPGVLWPKFEDQETGFHLAITGAIKDDILHLDDVVLYFLEFLKQYYPHNLQKRYNLSIDLSNLEILAAIGRHRGFIRGGEVEYERVYEVILNDYRNLHLGKITLDRV